MLMGAVWIYGSAELSQLSSIAVIGPGVFVSLIGAGLVIVGAVLTFQFASSSDTSFQEAPEDGAETAPFSLRPLLIALALVALPVFLMKDVGFPITAAIVFAGVAFAFGSRRLILDFLIGALISVISWFLFHRLGVDLGGFLPMLGI